MLKKNHVYYKIFKNSVQYSCAFRDYKVYCFAVNACLHAIVLIQTVIEFLKKWIIDAEIEPTQFKHIFKTFWFLKEEKENDGSKGKNYFG